MAKWPPSSFLPCHAAGCDGARRSCTSSRWWNNDDMDIREREGERSVQREAAEENHQQSPTARAGGRATTTRERGVEDRTGQLLLLLFRPPILLFSGAGAGAGSGSLACSCLFSISGHFADWIGHIILRAKSKRRGKQRGSDLNRRSIIS